MKKILFLILIFCCIYISGCCSIPRRASCRQLYSFTKEKKKIKRGFASKAELISIRDFRNNEAYDENMDALKDKVETYISGRAGLDETTKDNLRQLRVTAGADKEEVELLLGEPDRAVRIRNKAYDASEAWVYNTKKQSVFTVAFLPVFFGHEKYYLYFKDDILALIERHYLEQTFYASDSGMGLKDSRP